MWSGHKRMLLASETTSMLGVYLPAPTALAMPPPPPPGSSPTPVCKNGQFLIKNYYTEFREIPTDFSVAATR